MQFDGYVDVSSMNCFVCAKWFDHIGICKCAKLIDFENKLHAFEEKMENFRVVIVFDLNSWARDMYW